MEFRVHILTLLNFFFTTGTAEVSGTVERFNLLSDYSVCSGQNIGRSGGNQNPKSEYRNPKHSGVTIPHGLV